MTIQRRSFVGAAGALVGCSMGGLALGQGRPPVTAEDFNEMVLRTLNAPRFNCAIIRPADEGPFYAPASPLRRDITEGHQGKSVRLRIGLGSLASETECAPMTGAVVDIWHANARGQYSNVGAGIQQEATPGETFLRGHQMTDAAGFVEFETIVPGWEVIAVTPPVNFGARTTHIHIKIFHEWRVFDTQLYFPDELIDELYANVEPYRSHTVISVPGSDQQITRLRNSDDDGYRWSESVPMTIEQVNGDLVASAAIGTWGTANRGIPSFHGR